MTAINSFSEPKTIEWDAFVKSHSDGTPFHSFAWLDSVETVLGKQVIRLRHPMDGTPLRGAFPLALCPGLNGTTLVSVPFRDQGGPLSNDHDTTTVLIQAALRLAKERGCCNISVRRVATEHQTAFRDAGFIPRLLGIDTRLDLSMSPQAYWSALHTTTRWAVKKARKSGVSVEVGDLGKNLDVFFDLFAATRRRLGVSCYPLDFFQHLHSCGGMNSRLLLARLPSNQPAGALLLFIHGHTAYSGYLGYLAEYPGLRIVDALFHEAFIVARAAGASCFQFGSDSPLQKSLIAYKCKWLAVPVEIFSWEWASNGNVSQNASDTDSPQYRLVRTMLRLMPRPLFLAASKWSLRYWS